MEQRRSELKHTKGFELIERVLEVKRVTKVVKGGKRLSFQAVVSVGDSLKHVGIGMGKADEISLAIKKAILNAKKNLITIPLTKNLSIPHAVKSAFGAASIMIQPARLGTGVIAGGSMRLILQLGGIKNVVAKQLGSKSILNNSKATINALLRLMKN